MKGLEVGIERIIYIVAAIVFVLVIISISRDLLSKAEIEKDEISLSGDKRIVLDRLTKHIEHCWDENKNEHSGKICYKIHLDLDYNITERDITGKLDCEELPNDKCLRGNCSFCTSLKYDEDEKIIWRDEINKGEETILIKYIPKKVIVERETKVIG